MSQALKFSLAVAYSTVCAFHPAIAEDKSTITAQGVARGLGHHLRGKFTSAHELTDGTTVDGDGEKPARTAADGLVGTA